MGMLFSRLLFRYWTGAVWWFNSAVEAPKVPAAKTGVQLEAGVVRGRTVGTSHLLLALDSGAVQLVNLQTHPHDLKVGTGWKLSATLLRIQIRSDGSETFLMETNWGPTCFRGIIRIYFISFSEFIGRHRYRKK